MERKYKPNVKTSGKRNGEEVGNTSKMEKWEIQAKWIASKQGW